MGKVYILSSLVTDQSFTLTESVRSNEQITHKIKGVVTIKGTGGGADDAARTEITDDELAELQKKPVFNRMERAGYLVISRSAKEAKISTDMTKDTGELLTKKDIKKQAVTAGVNAQFGLNDEQQ